MRSHFLALDSGSSSLKAVVYDDRGVQLSVVQRAAPVTSPKPGWLEADMATAWNTSMEVMTAAIRQAGVSPKTILGLGVTGTGAGCWLVDHRGRPVRLGVYWNDGRGGPQVREWQEDGVLDLVFGISGNVMMPGYTVPLLRWFHDHDPRVMAATTHVLFPKDWLRFQLTGDIATDESDASYGPFDIARRAWSQEILELCGVPEFAGRLPPIRPATEPSGRVRRDVSAALGLPFDCTVATGLVDVAATTLGAGAIAPGSVCTILGTTAQNQVVRGTCDISPVGVGQTVATVEGTWLRSLTNTAGTQNVDWIARLLFGAADARAFEQLELLAQTAPAGSHGLVFHPYLSSAGVVAPFVHAGARGNLFGISHYHDRADVARAVYEGVALAILDCYRATNQPIQSVVLAGGGSRSDFWCQLLADVLGVPVDVPEDGELGARGAAIVAAACATGAAGVAEVSAAWTTTKRQYLPGAGDARSASHLSLYREIAAHLHDPWSSLAATLDEK
jgi:sugar (pentulose or hexulose) kinase